LLEDAAIENGSPKLTIIIIIISKNKNINSQRIQEIEVPQSLGRVD
jgi:hypothetical protein